MPSIAVQAAKVAISAATATGLLTITSNAYIFPGANAWAAKDDGTMSLRVKILACIGTNQVQVRAWPVKQESNGVKHTQENYGPPSYGFTDMSGYTGGGFHLSMEAQVVPVDPTYAKRVLP